jgi:cell wall-associated NlpC family hydrolase
MCKEPAAVHGAPFLGCRKNLLLRLAVAIAVVVTTLFATNNNAPVATADDEFAAAASKGPSYWIANPQGQVWNFGGAVDYGDLTGIAPNKPIIGMSPTTDNKGYWLVATDGGIFSFGNAKFLGSTGNIKLNKPIVGIAPTPSNNGYWMVASDGGIFAYGDAKFYGSTGSIKLNKPIVGMASTPDGGGYWLIASDGGIFAYGNARFFGSTGNIKLNRSIVSMTPTADNKGYWLVASDGGIFAFGSASFHGSPGGANDQSYSRILTAPDSKGYWLVRNGGDSIGYGSAAAASAAAGSASVAQRPTIGLVYNITGPGDVAILWAMGQQGKPYVWGGTGPNGFDCSGLVMKSWEAAGATLPRTAADQFTAGVKVPLTDMRPGDIVFWASNVNDPKTIYHDGLYIGGNTVVMAPKTGDVIRLATIWQADLVQTAVRPRS